MKNYKSIALQYLKLNKRRTILTILGTAITVMILYIIMNLGCSYIDAKKEEVIKEGDYEMLFYTETPEQIQKIMNDSVVKRAYVGGYYREGDEKQFDQALYVTGDSPHQIDENFKYLKNTYGIDGRINQDMAALYLQGYKGNSVYVLILVFFLVAYIFALFGVGIIRNSIQLSLVEQIKDYGNLRCIGSTVGQLRAIIYLQGAIMETVGIVIGVAIGQLGMSLISLFRSFQMNFHVLPIILIIVAYYFDLYFAMEENCKLVTGMSPVSALKGEFRIRKERIKRRRKSIYGRIFGVAGDYAYKNLMRSPGRFYRSVGAIFLGIAAMIAFCGVNATFENYYEQINTVFKHYQLYYYYPYDLDTSIDKVHKKLPGTEYLHTLTEIDAIKETKCMYQSEIMITSSEQINNHVVEGNALWYDAEQLDEVYKERYGDKFEEVKKSDEMWGSKLQCFGYDEEDYARLEGNLIEGTLDISPDGVVLLNGAKTLLDDEGSLGKVMTQFTFTDFHVGDTIDIVDVKKLREMISERMEKENVDYLEADVWLKCREQLLEQGAYKTYVVEGILDDNVNFMESEFSVVLPLERYYELTGTDKSYVSGMLYHVEGDLSNQDIEQITGDDLSSFSISEILQNYWLLKMGNEYFMSDYPYIVAGVGKIKSIMKYVLCFAGFIVLVSSVNIINTTASNIHMRRKEFAQLRVIGVSQKELMKMVLLEGVITTLVANIWGQLIGNLVNFGIFYYIKMVFGIEYEIPWIGMLLGLLISMIVLCGSVYVPMRSMKQNLASDLAAGGE